MEGVTAVEENALRQTFKDVSERQHVAKKEMALAAKQGGERRFLKKGDGFKEMQVHAESFHHWGQKLGYGCWDDSGFKKEYCRDVPESRVVNRPDSPSICMANIPKDRIDALFDPETGRMRRCANGRSAERVA